MIHLLLSTTGPVGWPVARRIGHGNNGHGNNRRNSARTQRAERECERLLREQREREVDLELKV